MLANALHRPQSAVRIVTGAANREKLLAVAGDAAALVDSAAGAMTARLIDGKAVAAGTARQRRGASGVVAVPSRPGGGAGGRRSRQHDLCPQQGPGGGAGRHRCAERIRLPADTTQAALLERIEALNADAGGGRHSGAIAVAATYRRRRDRRGGRSGEGRRWVSSGQCRPPGLRPAGSGAVHAAWRDAVAGACQGDRSRARALVLGRSALVGRPLVALLLAADATVTVAHSHTRDLAEECRRAEILIAADRHGRKWCAAIGSGRARRSSMSGSTGCRMDGWWATWRSHECAEVAGAITPVPGGVGPMTIACLLENTLLAAERRRGTPGSATG